MDEDEAALLAELRAISNKSSAGDRFANDNDDNDVAESSNSNVGDEKKLGSPPRLVKERQPQKNLPPPTIVETVFSYDESSVLTRETIENPPRKSQLGGFHQESTFKGERGGAAEDEELLAELRAISNQSASSGRFANNDEDVGGGDDEIENKPNQDRTMEKKENFGNSTKPLPPWKDKNKPWKNRSASQISSNKDSDVVVAAPHRTEIDEKFLTGGGGNFKLESTFTGERGGAAEDEELLAELRAISAKSAGTDRFASGDNSNNEEDNVVVGDKKSSSGALNANENTRRGTDDGVPPWKRKQKQTQQILSTEEIDFFVAAPPPQKIDPKVLAGGSGNFKQNSTFTGERGGAAEDEELLALLRGVSAKSGAADRFADNGDDDGMGGHDEPVVEDVLVQSKPPPRRAPDKSSAVPPWKQGKAKVQAKAADVDVVAAAPPPSRRDEPEPINEKAISGGAGNFKQKSTFAGERGGAAEDEELLALLRGVSAKSGAADRFADNGDDDGMGGHDEPVVEDVLVQSKPPPRRVPNKSSAVPPWKQGKAKVQAKAADVDVVAAAPPPSRRDEPEPLNEKAMSGGAGNFKQKSTFAGERGGAAEDEELLALLRGVSAKSGAADRFADNGDDDGMGGHDEPVVEDVLVQSKPPPRRAPNKSSAVPPWKQGKAKVQAKAADVDVVAAAPPPSRRDEPEPFNEKAISGGAGNFKQKSTFAGERGGAAEDEELLALLRGVSAKSGAADRFADNGDDDGIGGHDEPVVEDVLVQSKPPPRRVPNKSSAVPPWKQGKAKVQAKAANVDVVAAAPPPSRRDEPEPINEAAMSGGGGNFKQKSSFTGERGGAAEDEELLALLRGVSAKSGAADRFADNGDDDGMGGHDEPVVEDVLVQSKPPPRRVPNKSSAVPPWKQGKAKVQVKAADVDVVAAAPPPSRRDEPEPLNEKAISGGAGNFKQKSTFAGERGGAAEDEELLALLRGVSAKSGAADRFADNGDDDGMGGHDEPVVEDVLVQSKPPPRRAPNKSSAVPPWKQGKAKVQAKAANVDVVAAAPPPSRRDEPEPINEAAMSGGGGNFKQKSTFTGERGGAAEDEELLALLRGVSAKSGGADRFAEEATVPSKADSSPPDETPPRKRGKEQQTSKRNSRVPSAVPLAEPKGNFPSNSTFSGERGGAAEDAELLALLRGVSAKSGGVDRFADDGEQQGPVPSAASRGATPRIPPQATQTPIKTSATRSSAPMPMPSPSGGDEEIVVTNESLPTMLADKDWKVRKAALLFLAEMIISAGNNNPTGELNGNDVFPGLDGLVISFLMDKNANALEAAMHTCLVYADYCIGGQSPEYAQKMTSALIKGNGFTCPRPTAVKIAEALVIKLMEVGESKDSLKEAIDVLLQQGLTSRKPKIVQVSSSLILEAAHAFGAASLPIAAVSESLPKLLAHSNKPVRDTGMEIVAEFCRALGSKSPMNSVIEKMKKAQVKDLDSLLETQPSPTPIKVGFRSQRTSGADTSSPEDALAALQAGAKELEAERFARRPAINLMEEIKKTDYSAKLKLAKWSEKVAGLKMIIECGGEQPYKLAQPSSACNYVPLVHEMKGVLSHTHYLVVSKAMEVLAMLADGAGEKLYPNLRPLLPILLSLSKDKKLTNAVSSCLDSFFGNVLGFDHLLESDSALPEAVSESKVKNALARCAALDYLGRCVNRRDSAGQRGSLSISNAAACARLCSEKLGDSDASVRKAALEAMKALQNVDDADIAEVVGNIIEELKDSNPRAFKSLSAGQKKAASSVRVTAASSPPKANMPEPQKPIEPIQQDAPKLPLQSKKAATKKKISNPLADIGGEECATGDIPSLELATDRCSSLDIPLWDAEDEDGGVLAGLHSTNWKYRFNSIKAIASFIAARDILESQSSIEKDTECILVLVKEHTRGFKETNVNVAKSILELFLSLCDYHEKAGQVVPKWAAEDGALASIEKIADKKLSALSKELLTSLCVVQAPDVIQSVAFASVSKLKSPVAHEEFLNWLKSFCNEFGAASIGPGISNAVSFLEEESKSKNVKVKKAAFSVFGTMHTHLGPAFQAISLATVGKDQSLRDQLEKTFNDHPYDRSAATSEWPKCSLCSAINTSGSEGRAAGGALGMEIPKLDLISELPSDCLARMGSKDSKTAWKARKAAMEDVENALKRCTGLLDTSKPKPLVELLRALRERLSDSQSNLKPVAARLIGTILASVDKSTQGKMGKIVYGPLINAAMNDNKKNMHDAAMEALSAGTSLPPLEGEGLNELSLEAFVNALVGELEESEFKAGGIADVLTLVKGFTDDLSNIDNIPSQRGETLGGRFSAVLVDALSSSKSDTRAAAEALLFDCVKKNVFGVETVKKSVSRLKPAKQRSLGSLLVKLSLLSGEGDTDEKSEEENIQTKNVTTESASEKQHQETMTRPDIQQRKPHLNNGEASHLQSHESKPNSQESLENSSGVSNPLVASTGGSGLQKSRTAMKLLTWPEYPEEPSGNALLNGIKKAWAPLIPPDSLKILFPDGGIRKQDDATGGCELLSRAIVLERAGDGCAVVEQFSLIIKWAAFVLCCKESPVGLQALLSFLSDLFDFLRESKYELSDSEALLIVPLLLDKASVSKGRFKDSFTDLVNQIKCDDLLPHKRMGPLVCVALIEASSHPKATLLGSKECLECVEKIGLSGIGKKGVISAAKALSEAKLNENRSALLDLMAMVLSRMNGDMQRLTRICGSSLSGKARDLLEERVKKSEKTTVVTKSGIPGMSSSSEGSSRRKSSRLPPPLKTTPSKQVHSSARIMAKQSPQASRAPEPQQQNVPVELGATDGLPSSFQDELPALDLRASFRDTPTGTSAIPRPKFTNHVSPTFNKISSPRRFEADETATGVARALTFNNSDAPFNEGHITDDVDDFGSQRTTPTKGNTAEKMSVTTGLLLSTSSLPPASPQRTGDSAPTGGESLGAAASLRARLMKIREKNKLPNVSSNEEKTIEKAPPQIRNSNMTFPISITEHARTFSVSTLGSQAESRQTSLSAIEYNAEEDMRLEDELDALLDDDDDADGGDTGLPEEESHLDTFLETILSLIARELPLEEEDPDVIASTDVLKSMHAAVSKQANLAVNMDVDAVTKLREDIKGKANEVISILTSLINFGFNCHSKNCNAGMSVPLLSVNLASLMAIFRSEDLSRMIDVPNLTNLIKEAGKALLDPRLGSAGSGGLAALDEATSAQMVRAINKLAVQAATGTTRHVAFQALIALQLQLTTGSDGLDDTVYRSRLSRVVTKLFMRVVKAEESTFKPFSSANLDLEGLLCCLEDALVECKKAVEDDLPEDGIEACRHLAKVLILALMKERGDASSLLMMMEELGIDAYTSSLGQLMSACAADLGYSYTKPANGSDRDISALVSAVGSARQGPERDLAVDALRQYTATNGNEDLNTHLNEVSSAFRAFILEQLEGCGSQDMQETANRSAASSMSERIKNLRSKINATEAVVQSAVDPADTDGARTTSSRMDSKVSGLQKPSPTKLPGGSALDLDEGGPSASVRAFRQRLALAHEKRTATTPAPDENVEPVVSSGSRAAALRARLQAVKRQAGQS